MRNFFVIKFITKMTFTLKLLRNFFATFADRQNFKIQYLLFMKVQSSN